MTILEAETICEDGELSGELIDYQRELFGVVERFRSQGSDASFLPFRLGGVGFLVPMEQVSGIYLAENQISPMPGTEGLGAASVAGDIFMVMDGIKVLGDAARAAGGALAANRSISDVTFMHNKWLMILHHDIAPGLALLVSESMKVPSDSELVPLQAGDDGMPDMTNLSGVAGACRDATGERWLLADFKKTDILRKGTHS